MSDRRLAIVFNQGKAPEVRQRGLDTPEAAAEFAAWLLSHYPEWYAVMRRAAELNEPREVVA
jgi:hypothetical protein